jgi:hypothetical protein
MQSPLYQNTKAITLNEITTILQGCIYNNTPGEESINTELLKCASPEFVIRFLRFLNNKCDGELPESW